MTQFLPPNLLALFAPRDPIPYLPPVDKLPYEKRSAGYTGIAAYVNEFEDPMNTPPPVRIVTREERQENRRKEKAEQLAYKLEQDIALWNPNENPASTSDPYKTLFVARVNYDTAESKLRREFEMYGKIRKISIIYEKSTGKPRGYAFIEYDRERDMHAAYKHADGKKIDSRRVLVDVERGRTVNGWLPRRLGGGLGGTRRGGPDVNLKHSGREEPRPEDRHLNRERGERDRAERPERRRSRSRDRRRRSRSRSRERHRGGDRHKRDRSRDRTREHDVGAPAEKSEVVPELAVEGVPDPESRKESRRRSRSRDRDRRRRRSRSRDRKRRDDRDRDGRRDRERERPRDQGPRDQGPRDQDDRVIKEELMIPEIKQENFDNGYEDNYNNYNSNNNNDMESAPYEGY